MRTEGEDHLPQHDRSRDRRDLGWIIIRGEFHHVKTDDMKGLEQFKKGDESLESEPTRFGRSYSWEKAGIDDIKVEGDIDRVVSEAPHHGSQRASINGDDRFYLLRQFKFFLCSRPDSDLKQPALAQTVENPLHHRAMGEGFTQIIFS